MPEFVWKITLEFVHGLYLDCHFFMLISGLVWLSIRCWVLLTSTFFFNISTNQAPLNPLSDKCFDLCAVTFFYNIAKHESVCSTISKNQQKQVFIFRHSLY